MTESADDLHLTRESFPLERYEPLRLLGRGGLGEVYLARDPQLARNVAVKCLMAVDDETVVIFHREAKIASKLHHRNIVGTLDFGTTEGGRPYIAFEYFKGISLEQLISERGGHLDEKFVRKLFIAVTNALAYIHEHKVFHRDMKPSNIMVNLDDADSMQMRIIDFGVSAIKEDIQNRSLAQGKTIVGTPVYMSPDPVRGEEFDARSEVYSLGCIMYECLVGEPPFDAPSTAEVLDLHMSEEPPPLRKVYPDVQVSRELEQIILKCLRKDKNERFQTMLELADALDKPYFVGSDMPPIESQFAVEKDSISKPISISIIAGAVILTLAVGFAAYSILSNSTAGNDPLNTSESVKELTQDKRLQAKPVDMELFEANDDKANGAYLSGARGVAKLRKLAAAKQVKKMVTLKDLTIDSALIHDLAVVRPQVIQIFNMDMADREVFRQLRSVQSLQELNFHACSGIQPADLAALDDMPKLSSLLLVGCSISDEHLYALRKNKRLEKVVLDGNKDLTMKGLLNFERKPNEMPVAVWLNEGELTKLSVDQIRDLRRTYKIILTTRLPEYQGEGGDGMIHTDALELIE